MRGVQRFEDLDIWKLSVELRDEIKRLTETGQAAKDFDFRDQIRDASSSTARNIAEGFGRYLPRQFANFLRIARGSLQETRNHLLDGQTRRYFTSEDTERLLVLHKRALAGTTSLIRYLESLKGELPHIDTLKSGESEKRAPGTEDERPKNPDESGESGNP
jgi:four helix bundle protein